MTTQDNPRGTSRDSAHLPAHFHRDARAEREARAGRDAANTPPPAFQTATALPSEKLLPQNVEAEAAALGAALIDPEVVEGLARRLTPDMFYRNQHRLIFEALLARLRYRETYAPGDTSAGDLIAVIDELERQGRLTEAGGPSYVSSLANNVPTAANWPTYASIVEEKALQRRTIWAAGQIAGLAYNGEEPGALRTQSLKLITDALSVRGGKRGKTMAEVLHDLQRTMERQVDGDASALPFKLGFPALDGLIGGVERGDLFVLAARPGIGKSLTALKLLRTMLNDLEERGDDGVGLYFTLEMSALKQVRRWVSAQGQIHNRALRTGFRDDQTGEVDGELYTAALGVMAEMSDRYGHRALWDDDRLKIEELDCVIAEYAANYPVRFIVVDQLDLVQSEDPRTQRDEYERVSAAVDTLKQVAMRYGVTVICLAQINREGDGVRPTLKNLRSSGRIEQTADVVVALHRPADGDPEGSYDLHYPMLVEAWTLKVRDGGRANQMAPLMWLSSYTDVEPWPANWAVPVVASDASDEDAPRKRRRGGNGGKGRAPSDTVAGRQRLQPVKLDGSQAGEDA